MATRRRFLSEILAASVTGGVAAGLAAGQNPTTMPTPGAQDKRQEPPAPNEPSSLPNADKAVLDANEKDIKKKVEQLYNLATELKNEVEKTDSSKVLSLNLVRKAEEIEKLAKDIKNRSKG